MNGDKKISFKQHLILFVKSFFIQSLWNYKSMLSIGLCYTLLPIRKKIPENSESFKNFAEENLKFFNAHPYFAGYMIGLIVRLYEDEPETASLKVEKIKNLLISPLGAIGDKLFWENIKPSMMLLAVVGGLMQILGYYGWIIMVIAFFGYNIPHLYIRWRSIGFGYNMGVQIYRKLNFEFFEKMYKLYLNIGKVMWIAGLGITTIAVWHHLGIISIPVFLINFLLTVFIYHYTNSVFRYLGSLLIINVILTYIYLG